MHQAIESYHSFCFCEAYFELSMDFFLYFHLQLFQPPVSVTMGTVKCVNRPYLNVWWEVYEKLWLRFVRLSETRKLSLVSLLMVYFHMVTGCVVLYILILTC